MCLTEPVWFNEVLRKGKKNTQEKFRIASLIPIRERKTTKALFILIFRIHEIICIFKSSLKPFES